MRHRWRVALTARPVFPYDRLEEGQQSVRIDLAEQTPAALTDEDLVEHAEPA
jgi:hypothetical protein